MCIYLRSKYRRKASTASPRLTLELQFCPGGAKISLNFIYVVFQNVIGHRNNLCVDSSLTSGNAEDLSQYDPGC